VRSLKQEEKKERKKDERLHSGLRAHIAVWDRVSQRLNLMIHLPVPLGRYPAPPITTGPASCTVQKVLMALQFFFNPDSAAGQDGLWPL